VGEIFHPKNFMETAKHEGPDADFRIKQSGYSAMVGFYNDTHGIFLGVMYVLMLRRCYTVRSIFSLDIHCLKELDSFGTTTYITVHVKHGPIIMLHARS
jgi:hypothetical protein